MRRCGRLMPSSFEYHLFCRAGAGRQWPLLQKQGVAEFPLFPTRQPDVCSHIPRGSPSGRPPSLDDCEVSLRSPGSRKSAELICLRALVGLVSEERRHG